ncbi:BREX-1 system phosphatase PglZ type A [Alteromonas sp. D210916BOD_24]|uniref:BREX-1 system phosphatase PglZ type A n=1 Tax=Alteromonas sp. D210916BOD_24 TaxID=3157618 RepID=UPI00399D1AD5
MDLLKIKDGIVAKFTDSRIVFWQDEDQEFNEQLADVRVAMRENEIELIELDEESQLEVKQRIELEQPQRKFLLYSNAPINAPKRDWLYDIRQFGAHFYADSSAIILNELGMRMEFRQDISRYKRFFGSKQRYSKLQKILPEQSDKALLELAMIAVLLKVESVSFSAVVHQLFDTYAQSPDEANQLLEELNKYDLAKPLWSFVVEEFGYIEPALWQSSDIPHDDEQTKQPSLHDLLIKLLVTDCFQALQSAGVDAANHKFGQSLSAHLLPIRLDRNTYDQLPCELQDKMGNAAAKRAGVINFVANWRESRTLAASYNLIASDIGVELEVSNKLADLSRPEMLLQVETFKEADQQLLKTLAKDLPAFARVDVDDWVTNRLRGHWCDATDNFAPMYKALKAARHFYELKEKHVDGFDFQSCKQFYTAYTKELYQFDYAYRVFCENCIELNKSDGGDLLKATGLVDDIERLYVDWFLHDLAVVWGKLVDSESLLDNWKIAGVNNQQSFFTQEVKSILSNGPAKRVFVVISDALRYEVANEIGQQINDEKRYQAKLHSQLGVVPSYTQLGMGSLLPHKTMTAHLGKTVEYRADALSVHGLDNRNKILNKYKGAAFKANDVLNWTNQEGRDKVRDLEVVYIYHDNIDAIGDKQATENLTFEAARDAISEIKNLVSRIINRLNGSRVIVTADHGFLFKMTDVTDSDKTSLKVKPDGAVEAKKRYVIGMKLPADSYYWTGRLANTAGIDVSNGDNAEFVVPRGSNRFNFVGGAKFIHGGIMPQEICVPVLHVRELDTKAQTKHSKQKVGVVPLNSPVRIVSNIDRIQLLQTDAVGDKFKSRELELWIESPEGVRMSAIEKVLFDSASDKLDDRKRNVSMKLEGSGFDRNLGYKLILKDTDASQSIVTHTVTIDLAIEDDFF